MTTSYQPQFLWILLGPLLGALSGTAIGVVLLVFGFVDLGFNGAGATDVLTDVAVSLILGAVYGAICGAVAGSVPVGVIARRTSRCPGRRARRAPHPRLLG